MRLALTFTFALLTSLLLHAQTDDGMTPKKHFDAKNYKLALRGYLEQHKKTPEDVEVNHKIAQCYLLSNMDKTKAIPYIEFVTKQPKFAPDAYFDLGRAYHYALRYDDAITAYNRFIAAMEKKPREMEYAKRQIEMVNNARELTKKPLKVSFENMGKKINSEFADYYPFMPENGSFIVFTTRRKGNTGGVMDFDGYYTSEIYISEFKNATWTKAKNIGVKLNTIYDEQAVGLSPDGKYMMVYIDHEDTYGDLYLSKWEKSGFQLAEDVGSNVNTKDVESAGFVNSEGTIMFFASYRKGGQGGSDIWMTRRLPNGEWGIAENLGGVINTKYDEDFPILASDGKTLYFASEGHNSMGGFDIFKTVYDSSKATWSKPVNLGYPINDPTDNMNICIMNNGREAYVSAYRPDSQGDLDIYRVIFEEVEAKKSVVKLKVHAGDTAKPNVNAKITVNMLPTNNLYGTYKTRKTGDAAVVLEAGKYSIKIEADGFKSATKEIFVDNRKAVTEQIPFLVQLEPIAVPKDDKKKPAPGTPAKPGAAPADKKKSAPANAPKKG
jgi:hypothetical protein